jgi:hypothetical protein
MTQTFEYLLERTTSRQWRGFLSALAEEFQSQLGAPELRELMQRIGQRFAAAHPLPPCETTDELTHALNALWRECDWGLVELTDEVNCLRIVHHYAPLTAFGAAALGWTPAFLEGSYQRWLSILGATDLAVQQATEFDTEAVVEFRLERSA